MIAQQLLVSVTKVLAVLSAFLSQSLAAEPPSAVWDLRSSACNIKGESADFRVHTRLTVANRRGDEHATVVVAEDSFRKIKKLSVRLLDSQGRLLQEYGKGDFTRTCGVGAGYQVFHDVCYYHYQPATSVYPYTVDVEYEQELLTLFLLHGMEIVDDVPVTRAEVRITAPDDVTIHHRSYGVPGDIRERMEGGRQILEWSGDSLQPVERDTLPPQLQSLAGTITVVAEPFCFGGSCFTNWSWREVGMWYARLAEDRYDRRGWDRAVAPADNEAGRAAIKEVYDRVRDATRYVSMSIGVGGWRPRRESDILKTGYGDCKDLTTLLVSELRREGISARPALILTVDEGYSDPTFPSFAFNHVITAAVLAQDTIWMDPTCEYCCFGSLPYQDQNTAALLVTDSGGLLVQTSRDSAFDNLTQRFAQVILGPDRKLSLEGRMVIAGQYARRLRGMFSSQTRDENLRFMSGYLDGGLGPCKVIDMQIQDLEERCAPLALSFAAVPDRQLRQIGRVLYVDPVIFPCGLGYTADDTIDYHYDLPVSYARSYRDSTVIILDTGLAIDSVVLPPPLDESHRFGSLRYSAKRLGDTLVVTLEHAFTGYEIHPEDFGDYLAFEGRLDRRDAFKIRCFVADEKREGSSSPR